MDLKSNRNQVKAEANMASISDLVFLLLIFFILLSTMIKPGIPVDPPSANGSNFDNKSTVSITIDAENKFYINNDKRPVRKDQVEAKLKAILDKQKNKALVLNVDKKVDSEFTVFILDIANMNRWKVGIATANN